MLKFINMWFVYAFATIVFYTGLDFFLKKSAGKIDDFLSSVVINFFAVLPAFFVYIWLKFSNKEIFFTKEGFIYSIIAGLSIGLGTITFIKLFSLGTNLSLASPVVRIGTVALVTVVGLIFFRETLTAKQAIGLILSGIGLTLLVFK